MQDNRNNAAAAVLEQATISEETIEHGSPVPLRLMVSGLYRAPMPVKPASRTYAELRLDVDGRYPQMAASGTLPQALFRPAIHWIAEDLTSVGALHWQGSITWTQNAPRLFFTDVDIETSIPFTSPKTATVTFSSKIAKQKLVMTFTHSSSSFHSLSMEFDAVAGVTPVLSYNTGDHPNRPADLPIENLTIETVYRRAGFDVTTTGAAGIVPIADAGGDAAWNNTELNDAIHNYWSRYADAPQWAVWLLLANRHASGYGGIMFDSTGAVQRQGAASFYDAITVPAGDPDGLAWQRRLRFWVSTHELGHCFNLFHSFQKELDTPWRPMASDTESRSIMNYPQYVTGGMSAYFGSHYYRFEDRELLFLRHAPALFVEPGAKAFGEEHGYQIDTQPARSGLEFTVRLNRTRPVLEFLEPVVVELKLKNTSAEPLMIDNNVLAAAITVLIAHNGATTMFRPYAQPVFIPANRMLMPGEAVYDSLFLSAGASGIHLAEPGEHQIQAALTWQNQIILSQPLNVRVASPRSREEELLAQDYFCEEVGRVLAFDGSRVLTGAMDTLRNLAERFPDRRATTHARIALGSPLMRNSRVLEIQPSAQLTSAAESNGRIILAPAQSEEARKELKASLLQQPATAAETLGNVDFKYYVDQLSNWLADEGARAEAADVDNTALTVLTQRNVLPRVLDEIKTRRDGYTTGKQSPRAA